MDEPAGECVTERTGAKIRRRHCIQRSLGLTAMQTLVRARNLAGQTEVLWAHTKQSMTHDRLMPGLSS